MWITDHLSVYQLQFCSFTDHTPKFDVPWIFHQHPSSSLTTSILMSQNTQHFSDQQFRGSQVSPARLLGFRSFTTQEPIHIYIIFIINLYCRIIQGFQSTFPYNMSYSQNLVNKDQYARHL